MLIHDYAKEGKLAGIAEELAKGVGLEVRDERDNTPLMLAVASLGAGLDIVRFLLEKGADPNAVGGPDNLRNVLSLAAGAGSPDKVAALLDAGADIRYERPKRYDVLLDAMHGRRIAKDPGLVALISLLLDRGAKPGTVSEYRESALRVASNHGRFDAVAALLKAGADPAELEWTPLMRAVALGSLADVQKQLDQGADLAARDFWNRTPWLLSLQTGDMAKAKLLLAAGADRGARGRCGKVPLMYPITGGHVEMLRWLLAQGFTPNEADEFKQTPLMQAAEAGEAECAKLLLEAGADLQHNGETAVSLASTLGVVRLLVAHGADLNEISDEMRAALTRLPLDGKFQASREDYLAMRQPRFGTCNPEKIESPFWRSMVTSGANAYAARKHFAGGRFDDGPVWCFQRFGKSINQLPDGRIVEVAGEHEDAYDPDFYIYNDVVVHHEGGTFDIYGYPEEVFPPTDFHTATLVGKSLYLIGGLGYQGRRSCGETPVYRLDIDTFKIEKVPTSGDNPGWISKHKAAYDGANEVRIRGGKIAASKDGAQVYENNPREFVLDLKSLAWREAL